MKKLALWISILIIAAVLFTFCTGAEAVVIQGESSPGVYQNFKVDTSGILTSSNTPFTGTFIDRSGTITAGGTSQQLSAAFATRKYLFIQNQSSEDLYVNFTTNAVIGQPSIKIPPNASFVMESSGVTGEKINIIGATTGDAYAAKEW